MPSPSISARTTPDGFVPVLKSTLAANEPAVIVPDVLVFRKTETVLVVKFVTAISGLPSPSMSPKAILCGLDPVPVVKSTVAAKAVASISCELVKVTLNGTFE